MRVVIGVETYDNGIWVSMFYPKLCIFWLRTFRWPGIQNENALLFQDSFNYDYLIIIHLRCNNISATHEVLIFIDSEFKNKIICTINQINDSTTQKNLNARYPNFFLSLFYSQSLLFLRGWTKSIVNFDTN